MTTQPPVAPLDSTMTPTETRLVPVEPTAQPLWMMHVIGPDDLYPAPDFQTAVDWCAYLNREVAPKTPDVWCFAVPAVWAGTAADHAEGLTEAIKGWSRPAALPPREEAPEGAGEPMTEAEVCQWIDACNHEPARQVLRAYLTLRAQPQPEQGEASGEKREAFADALLALFFKHGLKVALDVADIEALRSTALRPQPSGEIGAAVQRVEALSLGGIVSDVYGAEGFLRPDHTFRGDLRAILALIRPAPVAGGGERVRDVLWKSLQKYTLSNMGCSDDTGIGYPLIDLMSNKGTTIATGREEMLVLADHLSEALSKAVHLATPTRSEALDEGAAGEWPKTCDGIEQPAFEAWAKSERFEMHEHPLHYMFMDPKTDAARQGWKAGLNHAVERMKDAHPSPTPTADGDRLRVAVTALEKTRNLVSVASSSGFTDEEDVRALFVNNGSISTALAALKAEVMK